MVQMALRAKVDRARSYWRALLAAEGGFWTLGALLAAFLLCFHLDRVLALSIQGRIIAWALLGVLFSAGVIWLVLRPVLKPLSPEQVATMVERQYPHLRERLLSAIEFSGAEPSKLQGVSPTLLRDLQQEAEREAGPLDFRRAFGLRGMGRAGLVLSIVGVLLALHVLFAPNAFGRFLERMALMHKPVWRDTMPQVDPPATKILKGTDLIVGVDIEGKPVKTANLQFQFGDGRWSKVQLKADAEGNFQHKFTAVTEDVTYRATAGDGISDYGKAVVVDPATIVGAKVTLNYPAYMDRPAQTFPADSGGVAAPVGTKVVLELKANKPLDVATVTLPGQKPTQWPVAENLVTGTLTVKANGQYAVRLKDKDGFLAPETQSFPIKAIPDQVPEVQLLDPTGDLDVVADARVPLSIVAKDDNGINEVRVPYQVDSRPAKTLPAGRGDDRKTKVLELENTWSLASLNLKPGDTIRYRIEATDYDNISGPHVGKTSDFQIRIIDPGEAVRRYEESRTEVLRQMAELIKEQKAARAEVERQRNAAQPNAEAIAAAEERQRSLAATAQDLSRRVGELRRSAATNNLTDASEQQAQKAVQDGLQQLSQGAMPEAANKIGSAQAQAQANPQGAKSQLGQASQQQEQIAQELQRLADQMKPGSELARLADRFQRLSREQRNLQAETDRLLPQTLGRSMNELTPQQRQALAQNAQRQQSLQRATEQAMQDLDRASQGMQSRSPEQAEAARETSEALRQGQVSENQSGAAQNTQQNALGQARSQQESAANELEKAADQLREAMNPNDPRQLQRQLRQAMNRLGQQMQQQQDAARQTRSLMSPQQRQEVAKQQRELQRQLQQLARQLERLQRRSPSAGKASESLQKAQQKAGQAGQQLDQGQQQQAQSEQQQAMQQMQRAMQSLQQAMAEAQQNDDPFAELRKKLTALATKQKAIGAATSRINEEQENKGVQPDDAAALQKLADQQSQVESETAKLEPELPGEVFKSFSQDARKSMERAKTGLQAANPKVNPTGQAQRRAQTVLEQLARALDADPKDNSQEQAQGQGQGQGQGQSGKPDPELLKRIAEIRLLRFMQQGIRSQTQDLDEARNPREPLTEEQKQQIQETARRQAEARGMADRVARALGRSPQLSNKVMSAGKHMSEAERRLGENNTGDDTLEQESQAIIRLTEALRQAQRQAQQQAQQRQRQQQQGQQGQQPGQQQAGQPAAGQGQQQQGSSPAMQSRQRRAGTQYGGLGEYGPGARGFQGLDPRSQDALRQGAQEKKPVEYQDLINRYLSALSNKGR